MKYTKETSPEEYQAWLDTNPPISEIIEGIKNVAEVAVKCCKEVLKATKRLIRSCLWVRTTTGTITPSGVARTVYPLSYDKNNPMSGFNAAALGWSKQAQDSIRDYYECEDSEYLRTYTANALARLSRVEQEIAMEELHRDALEILVKK